MKCPNCDGSGIVNEPIYNKSHTLIKNWAIKKCDICNGSGEYVAEPMTNEEYIKSLNTEKLAEYLADKFNEVVDFVLHDVDENAEDIEPDDYWYRQDVIVEWLKQSHSEVADDKTV